MKKYTIKVNGISYDVEVEETGVSDSASAPVAAPVSAPAPKAAPAPTPVAAPAAVSSGSQSITAPMPGSIVKINVKAGDSVKKGDVYLVLEAMKMENDITAPEDGTIDSVNVAQGASVNTGDVLVTYH